MEFKGTKEDWFCVFTMDKKRAVRTKGGIICILTKPTRYSGQDDRYDQELTVNQADQKLIASAPKLLEALIELKKWVGQLEDWKGQDPPCELVDEAIKQALG